MSFKLNGTIKKIGSVIQVKDTFRKREFVITDESGKYPQVVSFQLIQDNCDLIEKFAEGEEVEVAFNLRGREWTSPSGEVKYFNSLDAWKVSVGENGANPNEEFESAVPAPDVPDGKEPDLPF